MEIVESPVPELSAGEVLIRVERVGICGSELSGYLGQNSLRKPPLVMGHEFAGNVAAAATNVSGVAAGDFVVVNPLLTCGACVYCRAERDNLCVARTLVGAHRAGAFAEFVTVPAAACTVLTSEATRRWAFLIEPLACAVRAVAHAREVGAKSLLVQGSGMIGLCCIAVARRAGMGPILATDLNAARRAAAAQAWGAERALDPRTDDFATAVAAISDGLGVDAVLDCVGTTGTRQEAVRHVRPGGRIVLVGLHDAEARFDGNDLVRREISVAGSFAYTRRDFARAGELTGDGLFPAGAWLETRPLEAGRGAFEDLVEDRASAAKIALIP
jgi:2-desacetyl-2-hydroxyethyl bacteriochlorophyllide A dehydrogenase